MTRFLLIALCGFVCPAPMVLAQSSRDLSGIWTNLTITPLERPRNRSRGPVFEYALVDILDGARAADARAAEKISAK